MVRASGDSAVIASMVLCTSSFVSPGSPRMISILILSNTACLASIKASFTCATVCCLPISLRVSCFIVWGLTEILVTPCFNSTLSFSSVMLSARPASTVNSCTVSNTNVSFSFVSSLSSSAADNELGVPPPI